MFIIGVTFWCTLALFILSYFGSYFLPTFKYRLRTKEKVFWCLSFVRAAFGFVCTFFGIWYIAVDDILHKDVVGGNNISSYVAIYVCVGFFLFECAALVVSNILFRNFDPFLALHHTLSLVGYSVCTYYTDKGHFFAMAGLLLEMTTPFSCISWMFLKAKMAHLKAWKINQYVLVHLFHCRTTLEGYLFYKSYHQWDSITTDMPAAILFLLYTQLTLQFFLFTPYWTYKKMLQLFNPVDWNHPDLQSPRVIADASMNGHSPFPISNRYIPAERSKKD